MSEYIQNLILDSSTIAAISTGLTESGIGIIRVSGRDAIKSTSYFISDLNLENVSANTINYCHFSYKNESSDEVMVTANSVSPVPTPSSGGGGSWSWFGLGLASLLAFYRFKTKQ